MRGLWLSCCGLMACMGSGGDSASAVRAELRAASASNPPVVAASVVNEVGLEGVLPTDGDRIDDWHPVDLGLRPVLEVQAGDNTGNLITGIDAIGAGFEIGTRLTICNTNAPQDAGIVQFAPEDTHSAPNNRIWTPGYGRTTGQTATDRMAIGPSSCADVIYMQPDQSDTSIQRWIWIGQDSRLSTAVTKQLGLYPYSFPAPISGSVDDFEGTDLCPMSGGNGGMGGPVAGTCEAGSDPSFTSYTSVFIRTATPDLVTLTGMKYAASGGQQAEGQGPVKLMCNLGPGDLRLSNTDGASTQLDQFKINVGAGSEADIVLRPGGCSLWYHIRDTGGWIPLTHQDYLFDARDVRMTRGLMVTGVDVRSGGENAILSVDNSVADRPMGAYRNHLVRDVGTYDTTAGSVLAIGTSILAAGVRSTGSDTLVNVALDLVAGNGQDNYALWSESGNVYFGRGSQMGTFYANTALFDVSGRASLEGPVTVGGGDFNDAARAQTADPTVRPTASHGALTADSSNFMGRVEHVGAFTSVRLDFANSGFSTTSHCLTQVASLNNPFRPVPALIIVTPSATAPTFTCFAAATGQPTACPDFEYQCWGH